MDPGWFSWFQAGFHGFSWLQVGFSWFQAGFHGFSWFQTDVSWFQVGFSWFFFKMYPPELYHGPTIQFRSAARRAAKDLVIINK